MALIKCLECNNEMSDQAKSCPKCGWKTPSFKWWFWIPVGAIGLFAIVAIIGGMQPEYKKKATETAFNMLVSRKMLPVIPNGEVFK